MFPLRLSVIEFDNIAHLCATLRKHDGKEMVRAIRPVKLVIRSIFLQQRKI